MEFLKRYAKLLVVGILIFFAVYFWQWFMILVVSFIIAYLLEPVIGWLQRVKVPRTISILLILLIVFFLLYILIVNLAPLLIDQVKRFNSVMPSYIEEIKGLIELIKDKAVALKIEDTDVINTLISKMQYFITYITKTIFSVLMFIISSLPFMVLIPIFVFYLLKDKDLFLKQFYKFFNIKKKAMKKLDRMNKSIMGYIKGTLLDCLIAGAILTIGFYIFKLKYALLLGGIAGLFLIIPYIGPIIGVIPAIIVAIIQLGDWQKVFFLVIFIGVVELVNGYVLTPKIIGDSVNIHPLAVLFIIIIGAGLLGGIGLFISIPLAIIIRESVKGVIY